MFCPKQHRESGLSYTQMTTRDAICCVSCEGVYWLAAQMSICISAVMHAVSLLFAVVNPGDAGPGLSQRSSAGGAQGRSHNSKMSGRPLRPAEVRGSCDGNIENNDGWAVRCHRGSRRSVQSQQRMKSWRRLGHTARRAHERRGLLWAGVLFGKNVGHCALGLVFRYFRRRYFLMLGTPNYTQSATVSRDRSRKSWTDSLSR